MYRLTHGKYIKLSNIKKLLAALTSVPLLALVMRLAFFT